jgi:hypothetical protein
MLTRYRMTTITSQRNWILGRHWDNSNPVDLIPFDKIRPEYHNLVKSIFNDKFPKLLASHNYDVGDISRTLGYLYVPLKKEMPKSHKVYYSNHTDKRMLHDILEQMLKYDIIKKTHVSWGAPIFLIQKAGGGQKPM